MKRLLVLSTFLTCWLAACGDDKCTGDSCEACDYPIELSFKTPDGDPLDVRIVGASSRCNEEGCLVGIDEMQSGKYRLEISAKGYKSKTLNLTVEPAESDSSCGYKTLKKEVVLEYDCTLITCDACTGSAISLQIADSKTGAPIDDPMITGAAASCGGGACEVGSGPGEYKFELSAPGYVTKTIEIVVEADEGGCCNCNMQSVFQRVLLDPA